MRDDLLRDLRSRLDEIHAMGGAKRTARQVAMGKWTARQRLGYLFDADTFEEIGAHVHPRGDHAGVDSDAPADGVVTGFGRVNGRPVYAYAQDFTVLGGSLGEMHAAKICRIQDSAMKAGVPIVGLNDSGGARIQEGVDSLNGYGEIFKRNTWASGVIPQITVIMGPCAGGAVYSPGLTDVVIMVEQTAQMFITGPQVIKSVTGETVTAEELGGAATQVTKSGVAHLMAPDDRAALDLVKRLLSYLPNNHLEDAPLVATVGEVEPATDALDEVVPDQAGRPYDVLTVVEHLVDMGSFFEMQRGYADNLVVGLARMDGRAVGVVANQPRVLAGTLDINASDKLARFVRWCDAFNLPVVTLVDTPGYLPGTAQEFGGIIRHGAKVLFAYAEATVPKITIVLRKAYGGAYLAMCSRSLGADLVYCWPTAEIAVMGPEGAANIIYRREIETAPSPELVRQAKTEEYREQFANPYVAAERGYLDAVIEPHTTRDRVIRGLMMLYNKREDRPIKKHGNIPL